MKTSQFMFTATYLNGTQFPRQARDAKYLGMHLDRQLAGGNTYALNAST